MHFWNCNQYQFQNGWDFVSVKWITLKKKKKKWFEYWNQVSWDSDAGSEWKASECQTKIAMASHMGLYGIGTAPILNGQHSSIRVTMQLLC